MSSAIHFHSETFPIPLYSVLISHKGTCIQEEYFSPCTSESLHRMFSITKSMTALAVCALAAEGKIRLSDTIIQYFSDYLPENLHSYISAMTIQDLLDMRTCHKSTTYKTDLNRNWVESFFITPPDHRSGQIFKYDTSAAHTLAALVKRVSGKGIINYLRSIYLNDIGFSKDAYVLCDPFGDEIGGSGLVARPRDLMTVARFLMALYKDEWKDSYSYLFHDLYDEAFYQRYSTLVRQCMTYRTSTMHEGKTLDECQGYGSQFWMVRNGIAMYGMGGQYAVLYPDEDLIIVTTADTQSIQGGTQIILDEMNRIDTLVRNENGSAPLPVSYPDRPATYGDETCLHDALNSLLGSYQFLTNTQGFLSCTIKTDAITLKHQDCVYRFPISAHESVELTDPKYHQKLFVRTCGLMDGSLYQYLQILGDYVGSIRILIRGDGEHLTIYLRKIEESLFSEMNGFLEAVKTS